jgi:hypothetical protein
MKRASFLLLTVKTRRNTLDLENEAASSFMAVVMDININSTAKKDGSPL